MWPEEITKQLKQDEGFRSKPYRDTVGKLTIGCGRNLDDVGISEAEGDMLLAGDLQKAQAWINTHFQWALHLSERRYGVLANMAFNMGGDKLMEFRKMLSALQNGDFETAAKEMENSHWYTEVGARAHRLVVQMRTDTWQFAQP
jgi:lysozyme